MRQEIDVAVLGSGPAGLAAADRLTADGRRVVVLEEQPVVGGLMRAIKHGDYQVDIGRKELYTRLPEVVDLWSELLGEDYAEYPHRVGVLYGRWIIERSRAERGFIRGIPARLLVAGALDLGFRRLTKPFRSAPKNEEQFWYQARGRVFSRVLSQGHEEKFGGVRWADSPVPADVAASRSAGVTGVARRATLKDYGRARWYHPARGTGQIVEALEERIRSQGGEFRVGAHVRTIAPAIDGVALELDGECVVASQVVSTLRLPKLAALLGMEPPVAPNVDERMRRGTIIVYLFIDAPARFSHAWLDVTDPATPVGRVTNYAGFGGRMVPSGKACLAAEIFTVGPDPLLDATDDLVSDVVIRDLGDQARLFEPSQVEHVKVFKFPGAFAANDFRSWLDPGVQRFLAGLRDFSWLYETHRAGTDVATYAGLLAAEAIITGERAAFDTQADPARPLGIDATRLFD